MKQREIFILHTKKDAEQRQIAENTTKILKACGFKVWEYRDWEWASEEQEVFSSKSGKLDVRRYAGGDLRPFKKHIESEINFDALDKILRKCRVLVFLNPSTKNVSKGFKEEL